MESSEAYRRRKFLENELDKLKPEIWDDSELGLSKNIPYGHVLENLKRAKNDLFFAKFFSRINGIAKWLKLQVFPEKTNEESYFVADRIYNYAFWDGYKHKESEELTELILTEPYNRISKN